MIPLSKAVVILKLGTNAAGAGPSFRMIGRVYGRSAVAHRSALK